MSLNCSLCDQECSHTFHKKKVPYLCFSIYWFLFSFLLSFTSYTLFISSRRPEKFSIFTQNKEHHSSKEKSPDKSWAFFAFIFCFYLIIKMLVKAVQFPYTRHYQSTDIDSDCKNVLQCKIYILTVSLYNSFEIGRKTQFPNLKALYGSNTRKEKVQKEKVQKMPPNLI